MTTADLRRRPDDARARAALELLLERRAGGDAAAALAGDGLDFRGADLSGLGLPGAALRSARLDGVPMAGSDLRGALDAGAPGAPEPLDGEAMFRRLRELGASEVTEARPLTGPPDEL